MNVIFNKVTLHGFLSYMDAEISLDDMGYVLIKGINENVTDNASSNGSGKSAIADAICWAMIGETVRGTSNVVSNYSSDGCFVKLEFSVDNNNYLLIRSKSATKSNLQIFVNGEDVSGKGITESKKILEQYLPDLTASLIGSVIILGQGLPQKFTNNTPSQRKEILEKLSKSDFMIEDLKSRLITRKCNLNAKDNELASQENSLKGASETHRENLIKYDAQIKSLPDVTSFEPEIQNIQSELSDLENLVSSVTTTINTVTDECHILDDELIKMQQDLQEYINNNINPLYDNKIQSETQIKNEISNKISAIMGESGLRQIEAVQIESIDNYQDRISEVKYKIDIISDDRTKLTEKIQSANSLYKENINKLVLDNGVARQEIINTQNELKTKINMLKATIDEKKNIKDICPTCGQKIQGIVLPDTSDLEKELEEQSQNYNNIKCRIVKFDDDFIERKNKLEQEFSNEIKTLNDSLTNINLDLTKYKDELLKLYKQWLYSCNIILNESSTKLQALIEEKQSKINDTQNEHFKLFNDKKVKRDSLKIQISENNLKLTELSNKKLKLTTKLSELIGRKTSTLTQKEYIEKLISECNQKIAENENKLLYILSERSDIKSRLEVISKFENIVKRDFRGYLLNNVIEYINKKAKEYSLDVFTTDKINFCLNANNIDISYDEKDYYNLSGGEKQKVDVIIQFAIRDMLCKFLDFSCNLIFLDELTDNLDYIGCQRVIDLISTKLSDISSVFIISHHEDLSLPCDKEITVVKSVEGVSRIK